MVLTFNFLSTEQDKALIKAERRNAWVKRRRTASATVDIDSFVESPTNDILIGEFIKTHFRAAFAKFADSAKKVNQ